MSEAAGRPAGEGQAKRVAAGAGWLYGYRWGERLLDLISLVVLARILAPEDFPKTSACGGASRPNPTVPGAGVRGRLTRGGRQDRLQA